MDESQLKSINHIGLNSTFTFHYLSLASKGLLQVKFEKRKKIKRILKELLLEQILDEKNYSTEEKKTRRIVLLSLSRCPRSMKKEILNALILLSPVVTQQTIIV